MLYMAYNAKFKRSFFFSALHNRKDDLLPLFSSTGYERDQKNLLKIKQNIKKSTGNKTSGLLITRHLVLLGRKAEMSGMKERAPQR